MRKSDIAPTFDNYKEWLLVHYRILSKINQSSVVSEDDKDEIFEAFVLKLCAQWEALVQELLVDCLNQDSSALAEYLDLTLNTHLSRDECEAMLFGTRYVDFKSISDTQNQAKKILVKKFNPFARIKRDDADKIDEFFCIRNYLTHYSGYAKRKLRQNVYGRYFKNRFVEPGRFLRTMAKGRQYVRMTVYLQAMDRAARDMRRPLSHVLSHRRRKRLRKSSVAGVPEIKGLEDLPPTPNTET